MLTANAHTKAKDAPEGDSASPGFILRGPGTRSGSLPSADAGGRVSEIEDFQKLPYEVPFSMFIFTDKSVGQVQVSHLHVRWRGGQWVIKIFTARFTAAWPATVFTSSSKTIKQRRSECRCSALL